jgi:hypothetical protein
LAFQIADDILDQTATSQDLGKTVGKDAAQGKLTYVAVFGLEAARAPSAQAMRRRHCGRSAGDLPHAVGPARARALRRTEAELSPGDARVDRRCAWLPCSFTRCAPQAALSPAVPGYQFVKDKTQLYAYDLSQQVDWQSAGDTLAYSSRWAGASRSPRWW